MAAGSAMHLLHTPTDDPHRPAILAGYRKMMATLLHHQGANGLWHQLIDQPSSWQETSGSAMFTYAFIDSVNEGLLDPAIYGPAARKAWLALADHLTEDGKLRDVCQGTNIFDPSNPDHGPDGCAYYHARARIVGDWHGQAPLLWCATALLERNAKQPAK